MRQRLLEKKEKEEKKEKPKIRRPKIVEEKEIKIVEKKPKRVKKSRKGLKARQGGPSVRQLMFIAELWKIPNSTNVTSKTKLKNMIINFLEE